MKRWKAVQSRVIGVLSPAQLILEITKMGSGGRNREGGSCVCTEPTCLPCLPGKYRCAAATALFLHPSTALMLGLLQTLYHKHLLPKKTSKPAV